MSAILLPHRSPTEVDWPAFEAHVTRTADAGLVPAVNMDTGFVHLLSAEQRAEVLSRTRSLGVDYVAGAFDLADVEAVQALDGTPVVFPSPATHDVLPAYGRVAEAADRFIGFELSPVFNPDGRIWDLDTYRAVLDIPQCVAAKHSSLDRQAEWDRLRLRDEVRPDFQVLTGNDLAIDMVMYGSDYLLGLSTFAPARVRRARPVLGRGRPRWLPSSQRRAPVARDDGLPPAGAGLPPRRRPVLRAPRVGGERRHPGGRAPARRVGARAPGRHRRGPRGPRAMRRDHPQVKTLKTPEAFLAHLGYLGIDLPFADPPDVAALAAPIDVAGRPCANRFAILPMEGWDGTDDGRPTDLVRRRWSRFGTSGAGLVWGGEAFAVTPDGRANPHQLCLGPPPIATWPSSGPSSRPSR